MNYIDMLSKFGAGSAHPGGFVATLRQLSEHPIPANSRILEVGCGTGRTACHLAALGHRITAIDIHPQMLVKARRRAEQMGLSVQFVQADACDLPFPDESFDVILVESATNFMPAETAVGEYCRVLAKGGMLFDRELMLDKPMPEDEIEEVKQAFGIRQLLGAPQWIELLRNASFSQAELLEYSFFTDYVKAEQFSDEDPYAISDDDLLLDANVWELMMSHDRMLFENTEYMTFGLFKAVK